MEIIDIVDINDNVIRQATRKEAHSNPSLMHRIVHFTLINSKNKKTLLTQRSFKKSHDAGKYCFLGEHVMSKESYKEAVIRGIKEELGVIVKNTIEQAINIFKYDSQTELTGFYVASIGNEKLHFCEDEIEKVVWISIDKLMDSSLDISEMTKFWIEKVDWYKVFI